MDDVLLLMLASFSVGFCLGWCAGRMFGGNRLSPENTEKLKGLKTKLDKLGQKGN